MEIAHGEGFLEGLEGRLPEGIYLIDEPEVVLSPQLPDQKSGSKSQLPVYNPHPLPILMTLPNARVFQFGENIEKVN
jgi:predicted ATPase